MALGINTSEITMGFWLGLGILAAVFIVGLLASLVRKVG